MPAFSRRGLSFLSNPSRPSAESAPGLRIRRKRDWAELERLENPAFGAAKSQERHCGEQRPLVKELDVKLQSSGDRDRLLEVRGYVGDYARPRKA
jgi:hypothetical protein